MRSLTAGIPNGRSLPPSLGISTRLIGSGRYSPVLSARSSSSRYASVRTPNLLTLCPSTPAAPALPLTLSQATLRVWLRYTLSIRLNHFPPLTPFSSAANMRSLHTVASTHVQSRPWAFAPCLALAGTPGASLALCLGISLTLLPPCLPSLNAAFLSAPLAAYHRFGTMKALTPARSPSGAGLPVYLATSSCRSVSNHVGCLDIASPTTPACPAIFGLRLGIAGSSQLPAESSSFTYGPTVRLRLLPTLPRNNAVTFGYGVVAYSDTDFPRP